MIKKESKNVSRLRRHARVRNKISGTATCPRLNVFRSNSNIFAQIIDDEKGVTLVSSSSVELKIKNGGNIEGAKLVGKDIATKAKKNKIEKYLEKQGVTELKYLIATHPHADHIGEMSEIIDQFQVDKFIMPKVKADMTPTTTIYEKMLKSIKAKGLKITQAKPMEFELGSCKVKLFTPKKDYDDLNNYSTLVKITDGENSFLITGDCETTEEKDILSQGYDVSAKVLKAGHHGSSTSSGVDFLNKVMPRYAVISCGKGNKYGHPHEETVTRLKKYASHLYVTADVGTIVFSSDGEGLSVSAEKGEK